jgi:hypothetical protein
MFACMLHLLTSGFGQPIMPTDDDNDNDNYNDNDNVDTPINRFISRFHPGVQVTVTNVTENSNIPMREAFQSLAKNKTILQLYHCTNPDNYNERTTSIFANGFYIGSSCNKGYGIYLASHSNYAYNWGGRNHVIICDVIVNEDFVSKYISEIYSAKHNWEYVVTKSELVYPRYLVEFNTTNLDDNVQIWTNALCPMCPEHKRRQDKCFHRCDCKQYPVADPEDIIYL